MANNLKYSFEISNIVQNNLGSAVSDLENAIRVVNNVKNDIYSDYQYLVKRIQEKSTNADGKIDQGVYDTYCQILEPWKQASNIDVYCNNITAETTKIEKKEDMLKKISSLIETWDSENSGINLQEKINELAKNGSLNGVDASNFSFDVDDDGNYKMYYELDGEKISISDLLNAFYTYTGMAMDSNIEGRLLAEKMGKDFDENFQKSIMDGVNGFMSKAINNSYFGISNLDSIEMAAADLGVELQNHTSYNSLLTANSIDNDNLDALRGLFNGDVNGLTTPASSVPSGILAAYTLTSNLNFNDIATPTEEETSSGSTFMSSGGSGCGSSTNQTEQESEQQEEKIEIEKVNNEEIPEKIATDEDELSIDERAREIFESQDEELIAEKNIDSINKANDLFENDPDGLRKQLKEYGYSDEDIEEIAADRELTIAAVTEGERRLELAEIASKLAKEEKTDYDTSYDDDRTLENITSGESTALLSNMSKDATVSEAKTAYTDAKEKYTEAVKEMNGLIDNATESNKALEDYKKTLSSNTDEWSNEQIEKYNSLVKKYNEDMNSIKEKQSDLKNLEEKYTSTSEAYTKAKEDFITREKAEGKSKYETSQSETYIEEQETTETIGGLSDEELLASANED